MYSNFTAHITTSKLLVLHFEAIAVIYTYVITFQIQENSNLWCMEFKFEILKNQIENHEFKIETLWNLNSNLN